MSKFYGWLIKANPKPWGPGWLGPGPKSGVIKMPICTVCVVAVWIQIYSSAKTSPVILLMCTKPAFKARKMHKKLF